MGLVSFGHSLDWFVVKMRRLSQVVIKQSGRDILVAGLLSKTCICDKKI